jgi:O-antigen/teichoic acid export membrane protein
MLFAGKVVDSTDNMLISALVSTIVSGIYAFYITVTAIFKQLSGKLMAATTASMANLFVTEDTEKKITNLSRITFIFYVYASFASVGTYVCVQPFVKMWIGNLYLLDMYEIAMICILCFVSIIFEPLKNAMFLTGDFVIGRNISFISAMTNLIVSIVLGRKIGLMGILLGTMCTYIIEVVAKTYFLFRDYFKTSAAGYAFMWVRMSLVFAAEIAAMHFVNEAIALPTLADFLVKGVISVVVTAIVITLVFGRTDPFKDP